MKLNAKTRLLASDPLVKAVDWLAAWVEQSWSIDSQYTKVSWVTQHLKPLLEVVPYVPSGGSLYRVIGADEIIKKGVEIDLPANTLLSFTTGKGTGHWKPLADQVGANGADYVNVVEVVSQHLVPVFDTAWLFGPVLSMMKKRYRDYNETDALNEIKGYKWQKEVVAYSNSVVKTRVVTSFQL